MCLEVFTGGLCMTKGQFTLHRQMPTNTNKLVCWSLLDQCVTPVGVCWRWLEFVFTWLNMLNRRLLGRGMSEQCEMIFQQTTTNSDVIWHGTNRCHDDAHISLKACLIRFIRRLFRRMTHKDINNSNILIVVTGSSVSSPIRLTQSKPDASVLLIIISDAVYTGCGAMRQLSRPV